MEKSIACGLTVFKSEERANHEKKSIDIFMKAGRIAELKDGYSFYHDYSDDTFNLLSQRIISESKCCPFLTFELALEPIDRGYEISLRLRGGKEIKRFLKTELQARGIKVSGE